MMGGVEGGLGLVRPGVAAGELRAVVAGDVEEALLLLLLLVATTLSSGFHRCVDRGQPARGRHGAVVREGAPRALPALQTVGGCLQGVGQGVGQRIGQGVGHRVSQRVGGRQPYGGEPSAGVERVPVTLACLRLLG